MAGTLRSPAIGTPAAATLRAGLACRVASLPGCRSVGFRRLPVASPRPCVHRAPIAAGLAAPHRSAASRIPAPAQALPGAEEEHEISPNANAEIEFEHGIRAKISHIPGGCTVKFESSRDTEHDVLHWAIDDWSLPAKSTWPEGTSQAGDQAVDSPLPPRKPLVISFSGDDVPSRIVFVLKSGDEWIHFGTGHGTIALRIRDAADIRSNVLKAESEYEHWSLFNRLCLAGEILNDADSAGASAMALVYTWLRLSSMRQLDWYRNSNYQSKDIAHVQKNIAQQLAEKARHSHLGWNRVFARLALAGLPRGGGNGDDIRMGILNVMRSNGIREGHRPGIEDHFLEQWHQKLHTNTTPEDVTICEAYLAYQHSANMDDFWRTLWHNGGISRESLRNMTHPITAEPLYLPHIIPSMQHYLWILKTTHSGADLDVTFTMARGFMDDELAWMIGDILANRHEWWVPGKIVEARKRLKHYWKASGSSRDLLLLDIALESYCRLRVEQTDLSSLNADSIISLVILVLENAQLSVERSDFQACLENWYRLRESMDWSPEWARRALAAAEATSLCLQDFSSTLVRLVQPHAESFEKACDIDPKYIINFSEETIRGHSVFILGSLLLNLQPHLRKTAGQGAWQIASNTEAVGELVKIPSLIDIQGKKIPHPQVLVIDKLFGNEDIPENVVGILTTSVVDVLSHVAIRARSQDVMLASCSDFDEFAKLDELQGKTVVAKVDPSGSVAVEETTRKAGSGATQKAPRKALKLQAPELGTSKSPWVLQEKEFTSGRVGKKALNLKTFRATLPKGINCPSSAALPFGTFERVLADKENADVALLVASLQKTLDSFPTGTGVPVELEKIRCTVEEDLVAPHELRKAVEASLSSMGVEFDGQVTWASVWHAICKVWASKWTERAWLSRRAMGVPDRNLYMSVLLQDIVPADYAFVLHTADPLSGDRNVLCGEVVVGMGEALVGNFPGRALSFTRSPDGIDVRALPSKPRGLFASGKGLVIARSDSNGEDLEAFAGAGLYESVPAVPLKENAVSYSFEPLIWDESFRTELLERISKLGSEVEAAFGGVPQDIEGAVSNGQLFVVQSRPEVIH